MVINGQKWSKMGQKWSKMGQNGQKWVKNGQNGPQPKAKRVKNELKYVRILKNRPI